MQNPEANPMRRSLEFERAGLNEEDRTIPVSISSDTDQILRHVRGKGYGREVLDHSSMASIDLSRFKGPNGGPLLYNHNRSVIIGRFVPKSVEGGKLRGIARFGRNSDAERAFQDVKDEILTDVSIDYNYNENDVVLDRAKADDGLPIYRIKKWALTEASMVPIPADASVGVGRSLESETTPNPPASQPGTTEVRMSEPITTPVAAPAAPAPPAPLITEIRELNPTQVLDILDQAQRLGVADQIRTALGNGAKVPELQRLMLDQVVARGGAPLGTQPPALGMNEREQKSYSISRAIHNHANGVRGFETEVSQDLAKRMGRETNGVYVPTDVRLYNQRASQDATVSTQAAGLISQVPVTFIELLRNKAMVMMMGATYLPGMAGNVPFARQNLSGTVAWTGDNPGSDVALSDPTIEVFTMTPKQLMARRQYSKQLLVQTSGFADQYVTDDLSAALALEIDRVAIHGLGSSNQPLGIVGMSGIGSVAIGTNGGAPVWGTTVDLETALAAVNADTGAMGYLTNTKVRGTLKKTLESTVAGATWIWNKDNTINGYKAHATNQVSSTLTKGTSAGVCSAIIFGVWSELLILEWGALEILTDPYTLAAQGLIRVIGTELIDINVRHKQSFAACLDVL